MGTQSIIFAVLLCFGAILGFRSGLEKTFLKLMSLIGAYALAVLYFMPLSAFIKQQTDINMMLVYLLTAAGIFLIGGWLIRIVLTAVLSLIKGMSGDAAAKHTAKADSKTPGDKEDQNPTAKSAISGVLGAALGAVVWAGVAFVAIWALTLLPLLNPSKMALAEEKPAQGIDQTLQSVATKLMSTVTGTIANAAGVNNKSQGLIQAVVNNPVENMQRIKRLSASPEFKNLLNKPKNRELIRAGNAEALSRQPEFRAFVEDEDVRELAEDSGLDLSAEGGDDKAVATAVVDVWSRAESMRADPEVQALLKDPTVIKQIQENNYIGLMMNPKFEKLLQAFNSGESKGAPEAGTQALGSEVKQNQTKSPEAAGKSIGSASKIYSWKDEDGKMHYSDKKPAGD